jgi:hypothetical protein
MLSHFDLEPSASNLTSTRAPGKASSTAASSVSGSPISRIV